MSLSTLILVGFILTVSVAHVSVWIYFLREQRREAQAAKRKQWNTP